jgi:hypothetical protein
VQMEEHKRCNDCWRAIGRYGSKNKGGRRLEIKCTVTDKWVSPFAEICEEFESRGKREIGGTLLRMLRGKNERE